MKNKNTMFYKIQIFLYIPRSYKPKTFSSYSQFHHNVLLFWFEMSDIGDQTAMLNVKEIHLTISSSDNLLHLFHEKTIHLFSTLMTIEILK